MTNHACSCPNIRNWARDRHNIITSGEFGHYNDRPVHLLRISIHPDTAIEFRAVLKMVICLVSTPPNDKETFFGYP